MVRHDADEIARFEGVAAGSRADVRVLLGQPLHDQRPHAAMTAREADHLLRVLPYSALVYDAHGTAWVYGCAGENAFRREPELSDRQQNARIAMSMINQDVARGVDGPPDRGNFVPE